MRKKFIAILAIQTLLIGVLFVYAYIQRTQATASASKAHQVMVIAEEEKAKRVELMLELEKCREGESE